MERDFDTYKKYESARRESDLKDFDTTKAKTIKDAEAIEDPKSREAMLRIANKPTFQFSKQGLLQYGKCLNPEGHKFNKQVCFIPAICQLDTQECFVHRKDAKETK
jgi:hypothetical protein